MTSVPRWKRKVKERAKAWIVSNPLASIADTMKATGCSQSTVSRLRKELILAGTIRTFPHTPPIWRGPEDEPYSDVPLATPVPTSELLGSEKEIEAILDGSAPLTREVRRRRLEALVVSGQPDHVIRANESIEKMDARDGVKEEIGPTPPQTLDDAIDEASDIVEALMAWGGEPAVQKAVTRGMQRHLEDLKRQQKAAAMKQEPVLEGA